VTHFRRIVLLSLLATGSCDSGPTSDWPGDPTTDGEDDDSDDGSPMIKDAGRNIDASASVDAGLSDACRPPDAGDAGCVQPDF
jgi:hypothetical protein